MIQKSLNKIAMTENFQSENKNLIMATSFVHKKQIKRKRNFNTFYYVFPLTLHWRCTRHTLLSYQSYL